MHLTPLVLASVLSATAAAIDVHLHYHGGNDACSSFATAWCTNLNPNTCCHSLQGNPYGAISFRAIPSEWDLDLRLHTGDRDCGSAVVTGRSWGQTYVCLGSPVSVHGGGYGFRGKKREVSVAGGEQEGSQECQRADKLRLEDGVVYDLEGLDEEQYNEMVRFNLF
ncbi:hypothetical protein Micbo1qcDRAFT_177116 [Microdochium bolleyi]|uniref:Uncharacterized protein n=1 Tax=Microdochium bolleyi TaxID=196109 RepID=A0A136IYU8_9PEZI|nr:hypothetical protein Micbo1qcDRAFT_177116 [Microdochium bolleyi]